MNKLYTLQDCFEQSGSKFPFKIFYKRVPFTIISKNSDITESSYQNYWIPEENEMHIKYFEGIYELFEVDKASKFDGDIKGLLDDK